MIESLNTLLGEVIAPFLYVFDAKKRIYWLYLLAGLSLALILTLFKKQSVQRMLKASVSKKYWLNKSALVDYQWILFNQVLFVFGFTSVLIGHISLAMAVFRNLDNWFGQGDFLHWPKVYVLSLYTLVFFVVEDFSRFLVHMLYHKIPSLWRFHAIHHSAKILTPLTLYRVHFIEYFINSCRSVLVAGTVSGVFMYLFVGKIGFIEILGVSMFNFLFNMAGANLRHSHVWLRFAWWENIFISPAQHQIHHSSANAHLDKNFGASLAIWDKLFGSWLASTNKPVRKFGLYKQRAPQSFIRQLKGL